MLAPRQRDPNTPFALGDEPRSWGQLLADATILARGLPSGSENIQTYAKLSLRINCMSRSKALFGEAVGNGCPAADSPGSDADLLGRGVSLPAADESGVPVSGSSGIEGAVVVDGMSAGAAACGKELRSGRG